MSQFYRLSVSVGAAVAPGVAAVAAAAPSGPARSLLRLCNDAMSAAADGRVTAEGVEGLRAAVATGVRRLQGDRREAPRVDDGAAEDGATGGVPSDARGDEGGAAPVGVEAGGDDAPASTDDEPDSGGSDAGAESDDGGGSESNGSSASDDGEDPAPTGGVLGRALAAIIVTPSRRWM